MLMNLTGKFERWMELETSYALTKIKPVEQYPYWEQGITRGSYSFRSSALSYVQRARAITRVLEEIPQASGINMVQALGKAAHNLVALEATGRSYYDSKRTQIAASLETVAVLSEHIHPDVAVGLSHLDETYQKRRWLFSHLQYWQDEKDMKTFHRQLLPEMHIAADQFVSAAELYGWPEPGISSGNAGLWKLEEPSQTTALA